MHGSITEGALDVLPAWQQELLAAQRVDDANPDRPDPIIGTKWQAETTAPEKNATAVITFIIYGAVEWKYCWLMMIACGIGGYVGARNARRIDDAVLRPIIVVLALAACLCLPMVRRSAAGIGPRRQLRRARPAGRTVTVHSVASIEAGAGRAHAGGDQRIRLKLALRRKSSRRAAT